MHVTPGLAALAATVATEQVEREVGAEKGEIRSALRDMTGDDAFTRDVRAQLVQDYVALSQPSGITAKVQARRNALTYGLLAAKPPLPEPPEPPVRKDLWDLVVRKGGRAEFDELMRLCEQRTLQIVHITRPETELCTVDNLRDAHTVGFTSLMYESERYPNLCDWAQTRKNLEDDIARCAKGWTRAPQDWAAECLTLRIDACAKVLELTPQEMSRRLPADQQEYWSKHYETQ